MLDHVLVKAAAALRRGLEGALLERHAIEERFQMDVLLGDLSWETSYTLPFEGVPPRVQAEIAFDWSTWSQTAYRSWRMGDSIEDPPEIEIEIVLRIQRLALQPDPSTVISVLPEHGPAVLGDPLERDNPSAEQHFDAASGSSQYAVEVSYAGIAHLPAEVLEEVARLDAAFGPLGTWVASSLVALADLDLAFVPPELEEGGLR
jgi:hypothetical protein